MEVGDAGRELDGAADHLPGRLVDAALVGDEAQVMDGIDVVGVLLQDLAIDRLGLLESAGAVVLRGELVCFGERQHTRTECADFHSVPPHTTFRA